MAGLVFLDTNIFLYEFDPRDARKQRIAQDLVARAGESGGVISFQVVQEFLNAMTTKFAYPLKRGDLEAYLLKILWPMCKVLPAPSLYVTGMSVREKAGWSFYDSLIVSAALLSGCEVLYSEDLQAGRVLDGLEIRNPFA